ncbi:unnamed protein product [Dibothriocephalus latus]|uniref:Uncharacterized protein n=1 Tax=Dibothriocephalus latus TaxID=60516 RepID=A0A3P6U499_DIBLA|nr:unnamed protein product [Dibothriocephalus latus]
MNLVVEETDSEGRAIYFKSPADISKAVTFGKNDISTQERKVKQRIDYKTTKGVYPCEADSNVLFIVTHNEKSKPQLRVLRLPSDAKATQLRYFIDQLQLTPLYKREQPDKINPESRPLSRTTQTMQRPPPRMEMDDFDDIQIYRPKLRVNRPEVYNKGGSDGRRRPPSRMQRRRLEDSTSSSDWSEDDAPEDEDSGFSGNSRFRSDYNYSRISRLQEVRQGKSSSEVIKVEWIYFDNAHAHPNRKMILVLDEDQD